MEDLLALERLLVKGERGAVLAMETGRGQFAETLLSIRVPRWREGLVSKPQ